MHACQYAVVNDPALLDKYWSQRVYQPTGFEGDPADLFGSQQYGFGYNATRTYTNFDPEVHPCNEDKFEYIVHVLSCQNVSCFPNGDFDLCVNGENLGTYLGYDPLNPQDIPLFQGLPLYPYASKHNNPLRCGPAQFKSTIFGTSQEAIDHVVDTNFGTGWATFGGIGQPNRVLIPPAERRTLADYNTFVVPKDPFLMDARDIIIDQSGNPSFGPKAGSFDIKLIPNPGINNLRLDLDISDNSDIQRTIFDYATTCAIPMGTIAQGSLGSSYPVQWTPPSNIQIRILSLERPVGNDNVAEFRVCTVANVCLCVPNGEEVCENIGLRPLCVNPFDSDNYENGQAKFISSADFNASTECTCDDDEEYEEPQSPGDPNATPTCYYEADIFIEANLTLPFLEIPNDCARAAGFPQNLRFGVQVEAEGNWKGKTLEILDLLVDCGKDKLVPTQGGFDPLGGGALGGGQETEFPYAPIGSALRVARAFKTMVEDALGQTNGCPRSITVGGYVGPFDVESVNSIYYPTLIYGSLLPNGSANPSDAYVRFEGTFSYHPKALSDALASDIPDGNGGLEFNGTCCAQWVFAETGSAYNPENNLRTAGGTVREQVAKFVNIGNTWSTALGPLLNMDPGDLSIQWVQDRCQTALDINTGDATPFYLDIVNPLASTALFAGDPNQFCPQGANPNAFEQAGGCLVPDIRAIPSDCPNGGVDQNLLPPLSVWESVQEKQYYTSDGRPLGCQVGFGNQWMGREQTRIEPFFGSYDNDGIVYTLNDLSTAKYYYNLDSGCASRLCTRPPEIDETQNPCGACMRLDSFTGEPIGVFNRDIFNGLQSPCTCPPEPRDPCQPFAEDSFGCPEITNGIKEFLLDSDGNVYCGIICNTGYVLEYDDITGCAQCVQVACNGTCNYIWDGNSWNRNVLNSGTCMCKCEPPNIPGTFAGEHALGTCVDDTANRICGQGKCWWTWFVLVGGGGEWRKNAADDPFGFPTTCECRCDPPPNDGNFAGDQTATTCFE